MPHQLHRLAFVASVTISLALPAPGLAQPSESGNPIFPGWYADPEAHVFAGEYWIYPTYSAPYDQQTFMDAFSSPDLVTWTKHPHVLDVRDVSWAKRALWAPSIVEKDGWYYLFFGANDIQSDAQVGGIGVARSRRPDGPFTDYLGHPLIDKFHNGAQPIDQMVFKDRDGTYYIVYGGWRHCNVAKLNADFTGFVPFPDGSTFKEITPAGYVEGAFMLIKDGKYYFMWSEGGWTGPNYAVAYAIGSSPLGPFERVGKILQQDSSVATGAGHHSVLQSPASGKWYIVYHRRPLGETDRNHRAVSIDELHFDEHGFIQPVKITKTGIAADPLGAPAQDHDMAGMPGMSDMHSATVSPVARRQIDSVARAITPLGAPGAAASSGFRPVFGWIPTMGVHWIDHALMAKDKQLDRKSPSNLMFSKIAGKDSLVGAAYAYFTAESDSAPPALFDGAPMWHEHPNLAPPGQRLVMLHVWFVPSPDGPFASTNPNLPFWAAGLKAPDSARMRDPEFNARVRRASLALAEAIDTTSIFPNLENRPGVKPVLVARRDTIRALIPEFRAAERTKDPARWDRAATRAASQWDSIYAAYLSSSPTPMGKQRIERFIDMLLGHQHE